MIHNLYANKWCQFIMVRFSSFELKRKRVKEGPFFVSNAPSKTNLSPFHFLVIGKIVIFRQEDCITLSTEFNERMISFLVRHDRYVC